MLELDHNIKKKLIIGNHAVVQGLLQAKVGVTSAYPGTPSTEIQTELYKLSKKGKLYFEFSVNEKVAFEIAAASAMSGVRSAVIMKHVGLNVASDAMMAMAYFGVLGGMLLVVVDDPGCLSSQNEQDSRFWGRFAHLPVFEPSTNQEIIDMIQVAFELSEKYNQICILRLTNFTALNTSEVEYVPIEENLPHNGEFIRDINYQIPARYILHKNAHNKLLQFIDDERFTSLNPLIASNGKPQSSEKLIITHGAIYPVVAYLNDYYELNLPILKISAIHPLNEDLIQEMIKPFKYLYFIEELEPYLEREFLAIIGKNHLEQKVFGKKELEVPQENRIVAEALAIPFEHIKGDPTNSETFIPKIKPSLPFAPILTQKELVIPRTLPRLCDGCPHRGAFYVIKKATNYDDIIPSDIGCYALGQVPPVQVGDFWLCMGGGIGTALGFSITNDKPVIAVIGDGTFFHAGIPPLLDAVMHNRKITVAILDNYLTSMTGGQPTAGSPERIAPEQTQIDIEKLVKGCGVQWVKRVPVENIKENIKIFKEALAFDGPSVVIFTGICVIDLFRSQKIFEQGNKKVYIDQDKCTKCGTCLYDFSCPSILKYDGNFVINQNSCIACDLCINVCPVNAILIKGEK
ncbi:MAG: thiamine pyrophosphate-dependent enzyme [Candidatus Lokiarchaeota archaeon]|nr:thiamine pyrophosphate-dependent enzyme [Candidatus Harpocratesius repetitus]